MVLAVSLDLETLSTHKNAAVVSIGACTVSLTDEAPQVFQAFVAVQQQIDDGRHVSADTIRWWMWQSEEAQLNTFNGEELHPIIALTMLRGWLKGLGNVPVWTNGPAFDGAILDSLAEDYEEEPAIPYRKHRDIRTIQDAVENSHSDKLSEDYWSEMEKSRRGAVAHDAVQDAIVQGKIVRWWYESLRRPPV